MNNVDFLSCTAHILVTIFPKLLSVSDPTLKFWFEYEKTLGLRRSGMEI